MKNQKKQDKYDIPFLVLLKYNNIKEIIDSEVVHSANEELLKERLKKRLYDLAHGRISWKQSINRQRR